MNCQRPEMDNSDVFCIKSAVCKYNSLKNLQLNRTRLLVGKLIMHSRACCTRQYSLQGSTGLNVFVVSQH